MTDQNLVHVVDDDEALRSAAALALSIGGLPCITWPSAETFLAAANVHSRGCAVVDLQMPGMSGLQLLAELNARESSLAVVLLTGHGDVRSAVAAIKAGAADFIEKPFENDDLVARVRAAIAHQQRTRINLADAKSRVAQLTERERQVLLGLTDGKSSKELGRELGLSPRTVEMHRANMMERLGVRRASEAIGIAVRADIV